jgi:hypothetical protein
VIPPGLPSGTKKGTGSPTGPPGMPKNKDPPLDNDEVVSHCPFCNKKFIQRDRMLQHVNEKAKCRNNLDPKSRYNLYQEFMMLSRFNKNKKK